MNLSLPILAGAAGVLLAVLGLTGLYGWWQHAQLVAARQELSGARTALVLCQTDNATMATALAEQTAAVATWETWGARMREANARALEEAEKRRRLLQLQLDDAMQTPAGDCEAEAKELEKWIGSVRS